MPEYTIATVITMLAVIGVELLWLRTGIFRMPAYWVGVAIMLSFQVLVDGWLTKLSDPIVIYDEAAMTGVRFPWDIPIEDFGFGFAMLTFVLIVWVRLTRGRRARSVGPVDVEADADDHTEVR